MKVSDLIEALQGMDPNMEVHMAYGYGDYWRTTVAPRVSQLSEAVVEYSEYHRMDKIASEDYDDEDESVVESQRRVLVIE